MVLRGLLGHKVKPVWAIVISAAFFAIIHLNPWQAIPAFLLGCVLLLALGLMFYQQVKLLKPQGNCDEVPPIFKS